MSLRGSKRDRLRVEPGLAPPQQHPRVLLPRDDVRVGDDEPVAGHPARALDAQPARVAEDLHHASPRPRRTPAVARDRRRRRRHARLRAVDARERVEPRERARAARSDGGRTVLSCCRIAERCTSRRASPPLASASAPSTHAIPSPTHGGQHGAQHAVDGGRSRAIRTRPRRRAPTPSKPSAKHHPGDQRAHQPEGRRPRRAAPVVEQQRADPRARPRRRRRSPASASAPPRTPAPSRTGPAAARRPTISQSMPVTSTERTGGPVRSVAVDQQYAPPASPATTARDRRPAALRPARGCSAAASRSVAGRRDRRRATCPPSARRPTRFADGLGARRLRARCTRCSVRRRKQRTSPAAPRAHLPRRRRDDAHAASSVARRRGDRRHARSRSTSRDARSSARCKGTLALPTGEREDGDAGRRLARRSWSTPGLRPGEKLARETTLPAARDDPGARRHRDRQGRRRACPTSDPLASEIAGRVGPAPPERAAELARARRPGRRAGRPDRARARVRRAARRHARRQLLRRRPRARRAASPGAGSAVRTTIDPEVQRAAVDGARRPLRRDRGRCARAPARCSRSPGSPTRRRSRPARRSRSSRSPGVLEAGVAKRNADLPGRRRRRRSRASSSRTPTASPAAARCGSSFAHSCNSRLRAARRQARRASGSSRPPSASASTRTPALAGAARSTIPAAGEIGDDLAVGSTAIGQGKVLATPLQMALDRRGDRRGRRAPAARRCSRATTPSASAPTTPAVAPHDRALHARRGAPTAPASAPRSPASRSRARPAPPSCARRSSEEPPPRGHRPEPPPPERHDATPTPGSPPSRRSSKPRVAVACCSSARAPAATPPRPPAQASCSRRRWRALDVEVDDRPVCRRSAAICELQRAVLERLDLELEEQQRALDRALDAARVGVGSTLLGRDRVRRRRRTG